METKKTIFFIVEGKTDKNALETIFKKIYKNTNIRFEFTNGDITSNDNITKSNICDKIYEMVKRYIDENKLKKTDIWQIIQIFDTDGTYIPDSAIIKGDTDYFFYSTNQISCKEPERIKSRNRNKAEKMNYLLSVDNIKDIPYKCYYMSSNLDHALYNMQNLTEDEKREYADAFYEAFQDKEQLFIEFLNHDVVNGVPNRFTASWNYIKQDLHSLERHTNLHIFFNENPYI